MSARADLNRMEAEKIIDDLCLIDNVVVNYSQGRRRGLTDEETEDRALKAVSLAIEILARAESMNCNALLQERNRLLDLYTGARGEDRTRILAKLVVLDEELEGEHEGGQSIQRDRRYRPGTGTCGNENSLAG